MCRALAPPPKTTVPHAAVVSPHVCPCDAAVVVVVAVVVVAALTPLLLCDSRKVGDSNKQNEFSYFLIVQKNVFIPFTIRNE